uniref:Uncharacterized protein n=1 Tax=Arundo donax TaxID=35708 RepID=A0A0A9GGE0_ARUDO
MEYISPILFLRKKKTLHYHQVLPSSQSTNVELTNDLI